MKKLILLLALFTQIACEPEEEVRYCTQEVIYDVKTKKPAVSWRSDKVDFVKGKCDWELYYWGKCGREIRGNDTCDRCHRYKKCI